MDFKDKKVAMMEKYKYAVYAISIANNMPIDDAFDMLEANIIRGANNAYVNVDEFKKDYEDLIAE